jgi:Bacterial DNA-binding protein
MPRKCKATFRNTNLPIPHLITSLLLPSRAVPELGGALFVPGFAKLVVIKKPATKARNGINPFTKEPTIFKAKPARKVIRARPVKAVKDAVA